jgi:serine/threonine protein phosphatase PrpC
MNYTYAQQSFQGGREYNEDRTAVHSKNDVTLLVIADGLGGHSGGAVASQALVDSIGRSFNSASRAQLADAPAFLHSAISFAHRTIHERAKLEGYDFDSPKTTCVVCLIQNEQAQWAHSGDSRLYLVRDKAVAYQTEDHTSKVSGRANAPLSRCVGGREAPNPDIGEPVDLKTGDAIILATDGAWHHFKDYRDLRDYIDPSHPQLGLNNLLNKLESRNAAPSDNVSMITLFWGEGDSASDETEVILEETNFITDPIDLEGESKTSKSFDMGSFDKAFSELEEFIEELDNKL